MDRQIWRLRTFLEVFNLLLWTVSYCTCGWGLRHWSVEMNSDSWLIYLKVLGPFRSIWPEKQVVVGAMSDSEEEITERQFKIAIVGDTEVGKTSVATRYASGKKLSDPSKVRTYNRLLKSRLVYCFDSILSFVFFSKATTNCCRKYLQDTLRCHFSCKLLSMLSSNRNSLKRQWICSLFINEYYS